jgi:predicted O-linked N-acetylglucosamine transferase (SPINDLY family)
MNLGHLLRDQDRVQDALDCYRVALALEPDLVEARWSLAMSRIPAMRGENDDLSRSRAAFTAELEKLNQWVETTDAAEAYTAVGVQQPFYLAYQDENNRELLERYGRLCVKLMTRWRDKQGFRMEGARSPGPIRVGIVSRYFREHSVWSALMKGWFRQLDRERFALAAFCLGPKQNEETLYACSHAARFEQGTRGLRQWVKTILDAQPDVLIYPEIGMDPMTVKLASLRLAPVQVAAWGHPETTGLPTMDYYLSAEMFEPTGAQDHYSERLVALPHLGCFVEPSNVEAAVPNAGAWSIDEHDPLLLCPGAPFKYAPEHDGVFPQIARRLGRCRFIFFTHRLSGLSEKLRQRLESVFARSGLAFGDFVTFVPWQDKPQFFGLMQRADVYLDTIGFSGFNTAIQAVECGLPVVTREGRFMRGRFASGILKRMGLPELVAQSEEDFVALAVRLARDVQYREHIRSLIATSRQVLFEDRAPIRALEDFLVKA